MSLTKKDIAEQVCNELGFPKNQTVEIVESLLKTFKATLGSGEEVLVSGFGKFSKDMAERKGRNPATGDDLMLPVRQVMTFNCSGKLREKVNGK